ncbi:hypothetical protein [Streptomyces sp. NPDC047928]|uniref:hypothetical protein n=1 Tax=unclassified Streptomyces TaxID=2593676 RepID=UPI003716417E
MTTPRTSRVTTPVLAALALLAIGAPGAEAAPVPDATPETRAASASSHASASSRTSASSHTSASSRTSASAFVSDSGAAATPPPAPSPLAAAQAPATLSTLARFFARDGASPRTASVPRVEGTTVPVRVLSPEFVAGRRGAPPARVEFHAATAVSADGRKASVWTVRQGAGWQVVNIATGDDEARYAGRGARALPGGTVFREPQIDAWYVHKGGRVLPLDEDAIRAVGANGTTLAAYQDRVAAAYGDKLPGSAYARKGNAGGYDRDGTGGPAAAGAEPAPATGASWTAGAGAVGAWAAGLAALALTAVHRHRRRATTPSA